jgi:cell division septum initiation protein DivIVA
MTARREDGTEIDVEYASVVGTPSDAGEAAEEWDADAQTPREQRGEIQETREDLSETLDEIGQRLDPGRVADEAKQKVRDATLGRVEEAVASVEETAKGAGSSMLETIRHNPIPTAMAAIGLGMLWMNRSNGESSHNGHYADRRYGGYDYYDRYPMGPGSRGRRQGDSPMQQARNVAGQAVGTVGDAAGQLGETASDIAGQVGDTAGQLVDQGSYRMQQAGTQIERMLDENPLAFGAAALAAGALVGMMVPETYQERQMMGEASRSLTQGAQQTASKMMDKAEKVADSATQSAKEAAREEGLIG